METNNRIVNGIHLDNTEFDQPEGTMRDNRNGLIYDTETGRYIWRGLKGTTSVLSMSSNEYFMGYVKIRDRHFILTLNLIANVVKLRELFFGIDDTISSTTDLWVTTNDNLKLNTGYPIRAMFGIYENDEIIRLYFTDYHNPPRVINIAGTAPLTIDEKFIEMAPEIDNVYGNISLSEITGGSLKAGTYFFAWRLFKDGYYTDWSYLSAPFPVCYGSPGTAYVDYQNVEGQNPDYVTSKGIQIDISDIDSDYDVIQIAAFYSNDLNSIGPGTLIYEGEIGSTSISINYYGGENAGTITINEILETSLLISKCKDMALAEKYNVIANITERSEIDVSSVHSGGKNNQMQVSIIPQQFLFLLDTKVPQVTADPNLQPLYGTRTASVELGVFGVIGMLYHYALTEVKYTDLSGAQTIPINTFFKPGPLATWTSGTANLAIVIKKYRKASASAPYDLNTDYELETSLVTNDYYNFKNPVFTNKLKGYPSGEKVRFGILFFDKTGRPFFVRHLYNTETIVNGCTVGPGDTRYPDIYENNLYHICYLDGLVSGPPEYYEKTIGAINHFTISGIDITPIKDQIGGFAIVRCPIERENIAYGALAFTYHDGDDIYTSYGFRGFSNDTDKYPGAYCFYSPEDLYELKGFSIQPGDKIVNRYYMTPFNPAAADIVGCTGLGDEMNTWNLYQKFYVADLSSDTGNAAIDEEHEVLFSTKYRHGDGDEIVIDPRDETKLLRDQHPLVYGSGGFTHITNVNVLILDIDDLASDVKGRYDLDEDDPTMLVCSVKRPIASPYGGLSDSALASSLYVATGHYQVINDTVLADIEDGGDYVFNEVDVFGGDTFTCIWDFLRTMRNEDIAGDKHSQTFLMPIQTRVNLDLREGNHVGKLRAYHNYYSPNGLRWLTGYNEWEEFNYNDGYSSDVIGRYYLPVPINFRLENVFDTDIRYSDPKTYGEYVDSFRVFKPLNKYILDKQFGEINNIRFKFNNLIYWQSSCVGYIPMKERALTSNDIGNVIQLGVGGVFDRNDQLVEFVGNSNQFGLVESNDGFHWYDAIKQMFISITNSLKITPDSIILGLDRYFLNEVPVIIRTYDYPAYGFGISGGFDPKEKMVYISFRTATFVETIGFSTKDNKFTGFYDFDPGLYFNANNALYASNFGLSAIHHFGSGNLGEYFGVSYPRYFSIIVKDNNLLAKIFDSYELIGNDEFFTYINYTLENEDTISEYLSGSSARHVTQKLKYRNKRWFGNFPKLLRERLVGSYCKITFVNTGTNDARFLLLKTKYREMI